MKSTMYNGLQILAHLKTWESKILEKVEWRNRWPQVLDMYFK